MGHQVGTEAERAYMRGEDILDTRRRLMNAWANHCEPGSTSVVVPIRLRPQASGARQDLEEGSREVASN